MHGRLCLYVVCGLTACSLDGLADGAGGSTTTVSTGGAPTVGGGGSLAIGGAGGTAGEGGMGGADPGPHFRWVVSFGTDESQSTSPTGAEPGGISTLELSDPDDDGSVWVAAVTKGEMDVGGGFSPGGDPEQLNLFLIEIDARGVITQFHAFAGQNDPASRSLTVDAVVRRPSGGVFVAGTLRQGSLDWGGTLPLVSSQSSPSGYVLAYDQMGAPVAARHFTSVANRTQTVRALALSGTQLLVGGQYERAIQVLDPEGGASPVPCTFDQSESSTRAFVASLDLDTLACTAMYRTGTSNATVTAKHEVTGMAVDPFGVYLVGTYTEEIVAEPRPVLGAAFGLKTDGFVLALQPDLSGAQWIARASSIGNRADVLSVVTVDEGRVWIGGQANDTTSEELVELGYPNVQCSTAETAKLRDVFVGALDLVTGDCQSATLLGSGHNADFARALVSTPTGIVVAGSSWGIDGFDLTLGGNATRDGFTAFLQSDGQVESGLLIGGVGKDYLDGLQPYDGGFIVAGSYDQAFGGLTGDDRFYVALLDLL